MTYLAQSHDNQPIRWWGRVPVYVTTFLTGAYAVGYLFVVALAVARVSPEPFIFDPYAFLHGAVWQPFTYTFINPLNFFAPLGLWCFYVWTVEVEKYLGRVRCLTLFALLVLFQPVWCLLLYWLGQGRWPLGAFGNYEVMAGLLIAFATLYPNIEYMGWVLLKWFAFVCVVAGSLMNLASRDFLRLSFLLGECLVAWGYITWLRRGGDLPSFSLRRLFRRRPKLRVLPDPVDRTAPSAPMGAVDAILDKINREGFASLTAAERAQLEKAREILLRKEEPGDG